jgi:hypothetical protein
MFMRIILVFGTVAALSTSEARGQVVLDNAFVTSTFEILSNAGLGDSDFGSVGRLTTTNATFSLDSGTRVGNGVSISSSGTASLEFTAIDAQVFTGVNIMVNAAAQGDATSIPNAPVGYYAQTRHTAVGSITFASETPQYYRIALVGSVGATVSTGLPNGDPSRGIVNSTVIYTDGGRLFDKEIDTFPGFGNFTGSFYQAQRVYGYIPELTSQTLTVRSDVTFRASTQSNTTIDSGGNANAQAEARFTTQAPQYVILPEDLQTVQHTFASGQWLLPVTMANQPLLPVIATDDTTRIAIPAGSTLAGPLMTDAGASAILGSNASVIPGSLGALVVGPLSSIASAVDTLLAGVGAVMPGPTGAGLVNTPNVANIATDLIAAATASLGIGSGGSATGNVTIGSQGAPVNVKNGGRTAPGMSPGRIDEFGSYFMESTSRFDVELAGPEQGTSYDFLRVSKTTANPMQTGYLQLGGSLHITLLNGYESDPTLPSQTFAIATADQPLLGSFANVASGELLLTDDGLGSFVVNYSGNSVILSNFTPVALVGDYNHNNLVDAADYILWRKGLGTTYTQNDYDVWRANFGRTAGSGSSTPASAAVPEPASLVLLVTGILAMCACRRTTVS